MKSKRPAYVEPFFVGLFEGDGCAYIVKRKPLNTCFIRIVIALKNNEENLVMLQTLADFFGGSVYVQRQKQAERIAWSISSKKHINHLLNVFQRYPLLTSRKKCQLDHVKLCMLHNCWNYHKSSRDFKFQHQDTLVADLNQSFTAPAYFGPWLSGFSEAEGSFSSRHRHVLYNIGQNKDWYIVNAIKQYFQSDHVIQIVSAPKGNYYRIDIGGAKCLSKIIKHFETYPLLGYKTRSYDKFYTEATRILIKKGFTVN